MKNKKNKLKLGCKISVQKSKVFLMKHIDIHVYLFDYSFVICL